MRLALVAVLLAAVVVPATAAAAWKPGSLYFMTESDANTALERGFDFAYCDGIARFGKRGSFPYEEYRVFDCTVKFNGHACIDSRYKSVKGARPGYFRLVKMRDGSCY